MATDTRNQLLLEKEMRIGFGSYLDTTDWKTKLKQFMLGIVGQRLFMYAGGYSSLGILTSLILGHTKKNGQPVPTSRYFKLEF